MTLRLVYRCFGGENLKGRPSFYSKRTSLASFLQAAEVANAEVVMLADGPIPDDFRAVVAPRGRVIDIPGGPVGMRSSYRTAIKLPAAQGWSDDDLVYFSEDDYLHDAAAFTALETAAAQFPSADYFALYAPTPTRPLKRGVPYTTPADFVAQPAVEIDGQSWVHVPSTASTFGARISALRADSGIFMQGMLPYRTRLLDHETCMVYQGRFPYTASQIFLGPEATRFHSGIQGLAVNTILTPFRIAFELRSLTRRRRPHLLYAADPNLACHLETAFLSPGVDWAEQARSARQWADRAGFVIEPDLSE